MIEKPIKGIYLIERITNETDMPKYYIGQAVDIFDRFNQHCNGKEQFIDKQINQLGYDKFIYRILEIVKKRSDLDSCEIKWIEYYKNLYGDKLLYNISQTSNNNPYLIDKDIKNKIKELFKQNIGRSIYAISSYFNLSWEDVLKIRQPLLKNFNLTYSKIVKNIVDKETMQTPYNWQGHVLTEKLAKQILNDIDNGVDKKDINYIAKADLEIFLNTYNKDYKFADEIKN